MERIGYYPQIQLNNTTNAPFNASASRIGASVPDAKPFSLFTLSPKEDDEMDKISYNPHLYVGTASESKTKSDMPKNLLRGDERDSVAFTSLTRKKQADKLEQYKSDLAKTKSEQGVIGKLWDGFKNLTGIGAGSNKAEKAIEAFEAGKISEEELDKAVTGYKEGQKECTDIIADIGSGIAAFGTFALATGVGIAAAPFTGGASLGLVAVGFGIAGAAGAATKVAIKGADAITGGRKYDSFGYDIATGGINGLFAPVTAGIGGAAGKTVASKLGVTAIREGGEIVMNRTIAETAKGTLAKTLLTTNVRYTGGTTAARALALGADMGVNGSLAGAVDSGTRYVAGDKQDKSVEGFAEEVGTGAIGGLVLGPIIGGGMRAIGNFIGKFTGKLQTKVSNNAEVAKRAMQNTPVVDTPDAELLSGIGKVLKQAEAFVDTAGEKGGAILRDLEQQLAEANINIGSIIDNIATYNKELTAISKENNGLLKEILKDVTEGKDVSEKLKDFAQKSMKISDIYEQRIDKLSAEITERLKTLAATNEGAGIATEITLDAAKDILTDGTRIAKEALGEAKKITKTKAYKQLGELPEKTRILFAALKDDIVTINKTNASARKKLLSGKVKESLDEYVRYYKDLYEFNKKLESLRTSASTSGLDKSAAILHKRLHKLTSSKKFQKMTRDEQIQAIMEESNIMFAKFAQTFAANESLPPDMLRVLKQFTSGCSISRTLDQAQDLANELYGAGKYTIKKSFGAGTIGETYLAETADGTEVVIKMLKNGVSREKFEEDRALFVKYINSFVSDSAEKEYKTKLINGMFDAWERELDFGLEAKSAQELAQGAKRFSVAQTLEVGAKDGSNISIVQERAKGVPLDKLLKMLKEYQTDASEYLLRYADEIEAIPALANPEKWMKELGAAYQKAQNEQALFIGANGTRTIHADPHLGNVFVDFDVKTGAPKIVYIDAGNVVQRTQTQTLQDIALSLNMMIGNSKGIANALMEGATLPAGADKAELAQKFAQLLDERLYKAGVNLRNTHYTQNTINGIMKELNIIPDAGNSNLMKATLQRIETSRAINSVCGTSAVKSIDIKDLMKGILLSMKANPKETFAAIKPIMQWAYQNNDQAMITFFQMIMKNAGTTAPSATV